MEIGFFEDEIQLEGGILDSSGVQIIFCAFQMKKIDLSIPVRKNEMKKNFV